jgi:hypothetical protein
VNVSVLCYGVQLEIAPGVTVPLERCNAADLAAARMLEARKTALYAHVEMLVAEAARYGLPIDPELRERIALWDGDFDLLQVLQGELESTLLQPA